jgi:hypothetical protein
MGCHKQRKSQIHLSLAVQYVLAHELAYNFIQTLEEIYKFHIYLYQEAL